LKARNFFTSSAYLGFSTIVFICKSTLENAVYRALQKIINYDTYKYPHGLLAKIGIGWMF
jgi:hypothetical protein